MYNSRLKVPAFKWGVDKITCKMKTRKCFPNLIIIKLV